MYENEMDALTRAAEELELDLGVRTDYSGRGMYGATCFALTGDFDDLFQAVQAAAIEVGEIIPTPRRDSMGLGSVWYWPEWREEGS